jgi:hypothetical protein
VIVTSSANGYRNPVGDYTTPTSAQFHGPEKWKYGTTTVAVAGRLSTIKEADILYVVGTRRIVAAGTVSESMAKRGKVFTLMDLHNVCSFLPLIFFYGFAESRLNAPPAVTASLPHSLEQPRSLPDIGNYFRWQLSEHPGSDYGPLYDRRCYRLSYFWPRF